MHKVKNRKVIRRIADKTRKAQKGRNMIAVTAIALTALMFTSVFTVGGSLVRKGQENTMRQVGTSSHAGYKYLTQKEYDIVKKDKFLKDVSFRITVGVAIYGPLEKMPTELHYFDDLDAKLCFCYPEHGHMPQKEDEIVTSDLVLKALGIPCEIGQKVPMEILVGRETMKKTFTLSGYYKGDPIAMAQMTAVSKEFQEKVAPVPEKSIMNGVGDEGEYVGRIDADFNFATSLMLDEQVKALNKRCGFPEDVAVGINWAYMAGELDWESIALMVVLIIVILVSGYLIIYNIFYINVFQDIAQYGLLKTIGTTGKQLRRIVRRQAYVLSLYGIPIGLLCGALVGKLILPFIMGNLVYSETVDTTVVLNGWLFAGAALFSFGTVYISCFKPCRIASRVTAIEAVRYTEGQERAQEKKGKKATARQKMKKTRRVTPRTMAVQNVRRNRKKVFVVVASLSLALVLLNSIYSILSGFDMDKYISQMTVSDFSVADVSLDNFYSRDNNVAGVTKEFLKDIEQQKGIIDIGSIYVKELDPVFTEENWKKVEERIFDNPAAQKKIDMYAPPGETGYASQIQKEKYVDGNTFGVGQLVMEALEVYEGTLDWEKFKTGKYVITTRFDPFDDDSQNIYYFLPGEKLTIYNEEGKSRQYEVMAVVDIPYPCGKKAFGACDCDYILPEEEFIDFMGEQQPMRTLFNVEDEQEGQMEQWLSDYCTTVNADLAYTSKKSILKEFDEYKNLIVVVGNLLCLVLAIIGILNFINTVVTSVLSRKQEFAMMEAVGMTGAQLRRMLCFEGGYYAFFTGIVSLLLGGLLNVTVVRSLGRNFYFYTWKFTVVPMLICLPVLLVIVLVVPVMCYRKMCRTSVVERMRRIE